MKKDGLGWVVKDDSIADKTRVGYVRVSSVYQNESRQLEAFEGMGLYKIFVEKVSAKDAKRPMLKEMLEYVRDGDTVYVKDFSRLARGTKDLLDITDGLTKRGVKLVSLKERLDTGTATGRLMLTLIGAIYEFERENILDRQREGIEIAKRAGKFKGRRKIEKPVGWEEVFGRYMTRRITAKQAMEELELKRNTFYRMVKEYKPK